MCENQLKNGFRNAFLWEIWQEILWEIFKICKSSAGNAAGNAQ